MELKDTKTLTGMALSEVAAKLDAELPKDAYKAVPGAADLTDIDPNYMRKVFNEVFGMCGVGWGYKYDPVDLHVSSETRNRNGGGTRTVHIATLKRLTFWYKLQSTNGEMLTCEIDASGGSENDVEAYAMKGAITNALGNAASNIGFQESVYLGHRSHKTVGKPAASSAKPASKPAPATPAPAASKPASKPAPVAAQPAAPVANTDTPFTVKIGKHAGKTLDEIYQATPEAVQFYTTMATGGNSDKDALKNAAIAFLAKHNGHVPQSVAA